MGYVASSGVASFEGNFYYSYADLSLKINGTLSNSKGQKSTVGLLIQGQEIHQNPPTSVAYFQPSSSQSTCALLPPPQNSDSMYWFGNENSTLSIQRPYTSIYWNKGETFAVNEYFYGPYFTVIQRQSDSVTMALGQFYLAPFADY